MLRPTPIPPGPDQESVWDYPRPPRAVADTRIVHIVHAGVEIVRSSRAIRVLETSHPPTWYVPMADVAAGVLQPVEQSSFCEWKGMARYYDLRVGEHHVPAVAWGYPAVDAKFPELADTVAFYAGRVDDCFVGGERVTPQPGDFYGGWITGDVVGPFKGAAGSWGW